jgi:hypothetical protein
VRDATRQDWIWIGLWLALGTFLVLRAGRTRDSDGGVIQDHLEFGRRVVTGRELYAPGADGKPLHAPYPPSFGLMTAPFAFLPERAACYCWGVLQVLCLVAIASVLRSWLGNAKAPLVHAMLLATAVLAGRYVLRDTHRGGGNLVNLALVLGALSLAQRGRGLTAAACLGFSLATKPNLVLVVPLLAALGHARVAVKALGFAAAAMGMALLLLRQGIAPLAQWAEGSWLYVTQTDLFATPAGGFPPFTWMNQALRCAVERVCRTTPEAFASQVPHFVQGLGLSAGVTQAVRTLASLALLGVTAACVWRRRRVPSALPALVAATLLLSLLLSPISWKAHHVAAIPALFLCVAARRWKLLAVYLVACGPGEELIGKDWKNFQQSCYLVTIGALLLWAAMLREAWAAREFRLTET